MKKQNFVNPIYNSLFVGLGTYDFQAIVVLDILRILIRIDTSTFWTYGRWYFVSSFCNFGCVYLLFCRAQVPRLVNYNNFTSIGFVRRISYFRNSFRLIVSMSSEDSLLIIFLYICLCSFLYPLCLNSTY